jgi:hypothetical protein
MNLELIAPGRSFSPENVKTLLCGGRQRFGVSRVNQIRCRQKVMQYPARFAG